MRRLLVVVGIAVLVGCGGPSEREGEVTKEYDGYGEWGSASLEEMIAKSDVIIRGRFRSARPVGVRSSRSVTDGDRPEYDGYLGSLELTFGVTEYLKGSGGDQMKGVAYGYPYSQLRGDTPAEAAELARPLLDTRDKRWDDREAIVFFLRWGHVRTGEPLDYYTFGELSLYHHSGRQVTVASVEDKAWLPAASAPVTAPRGVASQGSEPSFLLDDPEAVGDAAGALGTRSADAARSSESGTLSITLSDLKAKLAEYNARIAAGDGTAAYGACIINTYIINRMDSKNPGVNELESTFESGLAAGSKVYTYEDAVYLNLRDHGETRPPEWGEIWYEGEDGHLFYAEYPGYMYANRPLSAGEYRADFLHRRHHMIVCDGRPVVTYVNVITVTAPEGTAAEALFDPVALDRGISATSTAKVFVSDDSPESTSIGAIGWKSGSLTVDLTPAGSFAGHHLDFIAADGTLAHTVAIDDATRTGDTLTWPVEKSPWAAGDKMMLRIRSSSDIPVRHP